MTRQQGGLKLNYVRFGCIVRLEKLAVTMARQQGRLKLDYVRFGCIVRLEKLAVTMTRQQSGLKLDSGVGLRLGSKIQETTGINLP